MVELIDRYSTILNYVISAVIYTLKERGVLERLKIAWIAETAFLGFNERDNPRAMHHWSMTAGINSKFKNG